MSDALLRLKVKDLQTLAAGLGLSGAGAKVSPPFGQ
jgi:hypothetical protein